MMLAANEDSVGALFWSTYAARSSKAPANQCSTSAIRHPSTATPRRVSIAAINDLNRVHQREEFSRTTLGENRTGENAIVTGRDQHPYAFIWMAGGGVKGGQVIGATDEIAWGVVRDPVHVHDLHATILHLMGLDHTQRTYCFQGRDFRLTDVAGKILQSVLA